MLDIVLLLGAVAICVFLLTIIFDQEAEITRLRTQLTNDANGKVLRGERGRFVSAKSSRKPGRKPGREGDLELRDWGYNRT